MKSLKRHEGWLLIDHSASPGIPADVARRLGLDPRHVGEGKVMDGATVPCRHCGGHVVKNPKRVRPRGYCRLCDHYICDGCDYLRSLPDYVHWPIQAAMQAALSGKSDVHPPVSIIVP